MLRARRSRRWRRPKAARNRCTPTRSTRRWRCEHISARIAHNTQIVLQRESGTTRMIDPWGGSFYVERLTHDLATQAWAHIREVEELGGMTRAIKPRCRSFASRRLPPAPKRASMPGAQAVIGVNKYRPQDEALARHPPLTVPLTGSGIPGVPAVNASATSLAFGTVVIGGSGLLVLTLSNSGNAQLTVTGIAITGANAASFSQTSTCGSLQPNESCSVSVTFRPAAAGAQAAQLVISHNAAGSPLNVPLSGSGLAKKILVKDKIADKIAEKITEINKGAELAKVTMQTPGKVVPEEEPAAGTQKSFISPEERPAVGPSPPTEEPSKE